MPGDPAFERRLGHALGGEELTRTLGPLALTGIGVATIVGTGVFVLTGEAAAEDAGPAVAVSFALAGLAALFVALCYAELASTVPAAGGTYSLAYVVFGPGIGWIVGWCLLFEYLLGAALIAVGWGGYAESALSRAGIDLPDAVSSSAFAGDGGVADVPAALVIAAMAALVALGARESTRVNLVMTAAKVIALALFAAVGATAITRANYDPFVPAAEGFGEFGLSGILRATGLVFLAYIGFDVIATGAREARRPGRDVPVAVLSALGIATLLYVAVALVLVGLVDYRELGVPDPLSAALAVHPSLGWLETLVNLAAVAGLAAGVLSLMYGMSRIFMQMADDAMLPPALGAVDPRHRAPRRAIGMAASISIVLALFAPLDVLADLISAGTLLAFMTVCAGVVVLRRRRPGLERPFRVPLGPVVPALGIVASLVVFVTLPGQTLLRLAGWILIGLVIYLTYSRRRAAARLAAGEEDAVAGEATPRPGRLP
jgi:APA family basic amino acid/polyamine antiporter